MIARLTDLQKAEIEADFVAEYGRLKKLLLDNTITLEESIQQLFHFVNHKLLPRIKEIEMNNREG